MNRRKWLKLAGAVFAAPAAAACIKAGNSAESNKSPVNNENAGMPVHTLSASDNVGIGISDPSGYLYNRKGNGRMVMERRHA